MRVALSVLAILALAACEPEVPDSAAGVGFGDYAEYSAQRETQLRSEVTVRPPLRQAAPADDGAAIAAQTMAALGSGAAPAAAPPAAPVRVDTNNPGISDEQNFDAVASRETIQSDRQRLEAQRENYVFIEPEPLPGRSGPSGPNIVQYAINAPNSVGQPRYDRRGRVGEQRYLRNCAEYASPDLAQVAFLEAGGPERDRLGLDPDGDGFACFWDPTPFRAALR